MAFPKVARGPYHQVRYTETRNRNKVRYFYENIHRSVSRILSNSMNEFLDLPDHRELRLGDGVLGVYVDGIPEDLVVGEINEAAEKAGVQPIRIPGYWMHQGELPMGQKPSEGEKVIYFLHGGSYVAMSAHPSSSTSALPRSLLELRCPAVQRAFSIEYRLCAVHCAPRLAASGGDISSLNPFPAQLLDALAGYAYLVNSVGFSPSSIILVGDSAGGHLTLALTRYLAQYTPGSLAGPGALLLLSPWPDMSGSHNVQGGSMERNRDCDIDSSPLEYGAVDAPAAFLRAHGEDLAKYSPYMSPAGRLLADPYIFAKFPRTLVTSGSDEMLLDQIRTLVLRMQDDMGESAVTYFEAANSVHDCVLFKWHEPERTQTLQVIKSWIETL
ncbi:alpha/beta-hydrolase [Schizopora paradoxa]|uniref:Alpha/beta-hydrolase n=1 Tax=Schizopora paradoxa TaxID=27342 RepID=A0A0H2RPF1_9AGAM|nr:alpha/beta-hydrolase [Schizopora paradoxa]